MSIGVIIEGGKLQNTGAHFIMKNKFWSFSGGKQWVSPTLLCTVVEKIDKSFCLYLVWVMNGQS